MKKAIFRYKVILKSLPLAHRISLLLVSILLGYQMFSDGTHDILMFSIRFTLLIGLLVMIVSGKGYIFEKNNQ